MMFPTNINISLVKDQLFTNSQSFELKYTPQDDTNILKMF